MLNRVQPRKLVYSTVPECFLNEVNFGRKFGHYKERKTITFEVTFKVSCLTKIHHYSEQQKHIFETVLCMRDKEGKTFKQISEYLDKLGYKTVRSNKTIKPQYVYSIYTKGKIRQNRINRSFESQINNVLLY